MKFFPVERISIFNILGNTRIQLNSAEVKDRLISRADSV